MKRNKRHNRTLSTRAQATRTLRKKLSQPKVAYDVTSASAETVGHRTVIGKVATNPAEVSDPEVASRNQDNLVVGSQAAVAMMQRMGGAHRIWSDFWFQQMQRSFSVLPELAGSRTPVRLLQVAADSAGTLMSDCMSLWMKSTNFSEAVQDAGGKHTPRAIVSNAKRLARAA